jgi:hypothetical protein
MTSPSRDGWWGLRGVAYTPAALEYLLCTCSAQHASAPSVLCELKKFKCETPDTGRVQNFSPSFKPLSALVCHGNPCDDGGECFLSWHVSGVGLSFLRSVQVRSCQVLLWSYGVLITVFYHNAKA